MNTKKEEKTITKDAIAECTNPLGVEKYLVYL